MTEAKQLSGAELAEIVERRGMIIAPWNPTMPSVEMGYTNGGLLWDAEGCQFGEIAPAEADYERVTLKAITTETVTLTLYLTLPLTLTPY